LEKRDGLGIALDDKSGLLRRGLRKERKERSQGDKKSHGGITSGAQSIFAHKPQRPAGRLGLIDRYQLVSEGMSYERRPRIASQGRVMLQEVYA
jgi:hypothetical protein